MSLTANANSSLTSECVNPLIEAVALSFETLLECQPERTGLSIKEDRTSAYELSAVIGLTGKAVGLVSLSMSDSAARNVLQRMVGIETDVIDEQVRDAVAEMANIIAGQAKSRLPHLQLTLAIPSIIEGHGHAVHFPIGLRPFHIMFDSEIGPFAIEAGFKYSRLN